MSAGVRGACHCGAGVFAGRLPDGIRTARRCDCSLCARPGAVAAPAPLDAIIALGGADKPTLDQFGIKTVAHDDCSVCEIYTRHRRRPDPTETGVPLACLDGHTPFLPQGLLHDAVNQPTDIGTAGDAGRLRCIPQGDTA